ncbi:miraculin-like [Lotus japonicus]|uniref:miraculin-like n=1 Tax=Lotus japonicus TaxID=34305 RepID=UPI00258C9110|nr:miraculin-like [Lotus japonicus]
MYKTMNTMLLAFLLLFALISQQPLLGAAEASPEQVVDITGKKLIAGAYYNVLLTMPYTNSKSPEGLALSSIGEKCPLDVVVVNRYHSSPLRFTPLNTKKGVVRVSTDLNVMFAPNATCPYHSPVWKLDYYSVEGESVVTTDGFVGKPGAESLDNWFKIEKYAAAYKLVYCPRVCISCKHQCKDLGMAVDKNGNRRLALSYVPFQVKFVKA